MLPLGVPQVVVERLPFYLRGLEHMANRGQEVVSSSTLGEWVGVSAAQIRKDLSRFGEFGRQGLGYEVTYLRDQLRAILHADRDWNLALVGAGALGSALVNYLVAGQWRYHIVAVFDNNPAKCGQRVRDLYVQPMSELKSTVAAKRINLAVLAVPADAAQEVADELVRCGVRGLLNYAPIRLNVPPGVHCAEIDPIARLQSITYFL